MPRCASAGPILPHTDLAGSASVDGDKEALISEVGAALYAAKRSGKNRTVTAGETVETANVYGGQ